MDGLQQLAARFRNSPSEARIYLEKLVSGLDWISVPLTSSQCDQHGCGVFHTTGAKSLLRQEINLSMGKVAPFCCLEHQNWDYAWPPVFSSFLKKNEKRRKKKKRKRKEKTHSAKVHLHVTVGYSFRMTSSMLCSGQQQSSSSSCSTNSAHINSPSLSQCPTFKEYSPQHAVLWQILHHNNEWSLMLQSRSKVSCMPHPHSL